MIDVYLFTQRKDSTSMSKQGKAVTMNQLKEAKKELTRFMMKYKFALDEMTTKIEILEEEFRYIHEYNPIENISSRLKTPESLLLKVQRKQLPININEIKKHIMDIAGVRINCSFQKDIFLLKEMIESQDDLKVIEVKDYITKPKPNGYRSMHIIVEVPVYLSNCRECIPVEIQIRTVAMDFWASLEHKIFYKFEKEVPSEMTTELKKVADTAAELDQQMEALHNESLKYTTEADESQLFGSLRFDQERLQLPNELLNSLSALQEKKNS